MHSGVCSSDSLRSLKSRRNREVEFTLELGVWSHSGGCSLEFAVIPGLWSGVTPEFEVSHRSLESAFIPEPRNWSHFGVWSLEPIRNMEARVWMYSGLCSLHPLGSL